MLVCYALERRSHWFVLLFAVSCALGSAYGFLQGLGRLGWSRRSGQPSPCGAGSWCALDFCTYPPAVSGCPPRPHGVNLNKKGPPVSRPFCDLRFYAAAGRRIRVRPFNRIRRRAGMSACPTCERSSPQQHSNPLLGIAACLTSAAASFSVGLTPKIGKERFRFGGNREPHSCGR